MFRLLWQNCHKSICSIQFYSSSHIQVLGISGFKTGNRILTDDVVYSVRDASEVEIKFYKEDGITVSASKSLSYEEFLSLLDPKDDFDHRGFTLLTDVFPEFSAIEGLILCDSCSNQIGRSIAVIGYQNQHKNLSFETGIISAGFVNEKGLEFIQYNGTIKPGNTGAPLIDAEYGSVLGVVMNKELPVRKSYKELIRIIDSNLQVLKEAEGRFKMYEIDPIQVLIANQNQIKHIAKEFYMHAMIQTGFALEIEHVIEHLDGKSSLDLEPERDPGIDDL